MRADPSLISVTAKLAAYYRGFSDIPFAAEVAKRIGAEEAFEGILREHHLERDKLTFYAPMFEARYKSITQLISKSGASQVLELASGYSLRGLDLTQQGTLRYVETDLPNVIATKRALIEDLGLQPSPRHAVVSADALDLEEVRSAAASLDPKERLTILCEGLVMYLSKTETEKLATNIHTMLRAGGSWICPDFTFRSEMKDLAPERLRLREAVTGVTQRQVDASAFEDADDLNAFLHRMGFDVQVKSQIDETPSFSSLEPLGLAPAMLDRMKGILRVWVMTPR